VKQGTLATPIGGVKRIHSADKEFLWIFLFAVLSLINGLKIAVPIILVQHKRHERLGDALTPLRHVSLSGTELDY
jgi:hypothetical protein